MTPAEAMRHTDSSAVGGNEPSMLNSVDAESPLYPSGPAGWHSAGTVQKPCLEICIKLQSLTAERDRYRRELERLMDLVGEVDRDLIEKALKQD